MRNLSASGSKTLPHRDCQEKRRASQPSARSESPANMARPSAQPKYPASSAHTSGGTASMRAMVSKLGIKLRFNAPACKTTCGFVHAAQVRAARPAPDRTPGPRRSEEHTSELQSRGHLVCRLLLEKKKKT